MSLWTRITEALAALTQGESLAEVFDRLRTPPERSVGFTIAVIALGCVGRWERTNVGKLKFDCKTGKARSKKSRANGALT